MTVTASQGLRPACQERQSADRCHAQAAVRRPISHHRLAAGHAEGQHHERRCERMQRCHAASTSGSNGKVMETEGFRWPEKKQVRSNAEVISILGLGTWRLKGRMDEAFAALAAQLEGAWRHHFNMELRLCHLPEDLKFADSLDPERTIGEYSYVELADPPEGERSAGWPRLLIENRAYCTRVFRKLHVELAARQDGLQVLHCVLYPRLEYDLPILSVDMVGSAATGRISLAIADPCPAAMDRSLPPAYAETVRQLQKKYGMESNRSIPEWGQAIFSDLCVIICPETADELRRFLLYTVALHKAHLLLSSNAQPVTQARESQRRLADIHSAHQRYCKNQQENSKTSAVLQAAFSSEFARRYMSEIMFDVESGAPDALSVA